MVVEIDNYYVYYNEKIFLDLERFELERWFFGGSLRGMEKYLVFFGMGNMMCVGYMLVNLNFNYVVVGVVINFKLDFIEFFWN